jgi:hypothetical protein
VIHWNGREILDWYLATSEPDDLGQTPTLPRLRRGPSLPANGGRFRSAEHHPCAGRVRAYAALRPGPRHDAADRASDYSRDSRAPAAGAARRGRLARPGIGSSSMSRNGTSTRRCPAPC